MKPRAALGRQPGRLGATMLRALCAELSDSGRYSRAKSYARDGAVVEIDVRPGVVTAEVLGSRRYPYSVTIGVDGLPPEELHAQGAPTMLIPEPHELAVDCTCPDNDAGFGGAICKHALAVLLVLADEISIEPELLPLWRSGAAGEHQTGHRPPPRTYAVEPPRPRPRVDVLAAQLRAPQPIGELPDFGELAPPDLHTPPAAADHLSGLLDAVLAEALDVITGRR